jgi:hypothetical protein
MQTLWTVTINQEDYGLPDPLVDRANLKLYPATRFCCSSLGLSAGGGWRGLWTLNLSYQ